MTKGLGKGFDVLIPTDFDESILLDSREMIQKLKIEDVKPNPDQPRRVFDKQALEELAASIKRYGILQPLIVSPSNEGYTIVAGERRFRAAKLAKLGEVPAIVRKREELEQLEIALIENVQRVDLSPLEQAISIEKLHQQFNFSYQSIADRLGKGHSTVHNIVRLLQLPVEAREALQNSEISEGHARAILALKNDVQKQSELLDLIVKKRWSVRQAEQFVTSVKAGSQSEKAKTATISETPETKNISNKFGTKVTLRRMAKGGRVEIHYKSEEELGKIFSKFNNF